MKQHIKLLLTPAFVLLVAHVSLSAPIKTVYDSLLEHGVHFDTNAVHAAAVRGMLGAIDPYARIGSKDEMSRIMSGTVIGKSEKWPERICYLQLKGMYPGGAQEVAEKLDTLREFASTGLIVDMRGADGNDLDSVDGIAGRLLGGNNVSYRLRTGTNITVRTTGASGSDDNSSGKAGKIVCPVMVLIDGMTMGASEVLAAVFKGQQGVMLLGTATQGDLRLREVIPVSEEEAVYVATCRVIGIGVDGGTVVNVEPDITVSPSELSDFDGDHSGGKSYRDLSDRAKLDRKLMLRVSGDAALARATDILLGLRALSGLKEDLSVEPIPADAGAQGQ